MAALRRRWLDSCLFSPLPRGVPSETPSAEPSAEPCAESGTWLKNVIGLGAQEGLSRKSSMFFCDWLGAEPGHHSSHGHRKIMPARTMQPA